MRTQEISILIGGKAGDGIRQAGIGLAGLLNELGYWIFLYDDYPSVIRGGHNFSVIRASAERIMSQRDDFDILIALDQNTLAKHNGQLAEQGLVIFDADAVKAEGLGLPLTSLAKKNNLPLIVRNTEVLAALGAVLGVEFAVIEQAIKKSLNKKIEENIAVAREAYELALATGKKIDLPPLSNSPKELLTGNEALALGLVKGGLEIFTAYPMTPTTTILHYLADNRKKFNLQVVHAENEIGVIGMAEGAAYAGKRSAVCTSGGGFALMVEHLSLAGQAEIPLVIVLGQRPGPATGLPTYSGQGELFFALYAGHGEFPRVVIAPGDPEEAMAAARDALNLAWQFQIPVIVLADKHLCESAFSSEPEKIAAKIFPPKLWDKQGTYRRYALTEDGVSPLCFPGEPGAVVKSDSYEHDEDGITTEEAEMAVKNADKRMRKAAAIAEELKKRETVKTYGPSESENVLLVWGSTKGSAIEAAALTGCRVVQPLYLEPFPEAELKEKLKNAKKIIGVELNSGGQLCRLAASHGIKIDERILKYDGRPFTADAIAEKVRKLI